MAKRDYYEVLGVARDAGEKEIKSAYRKLAIQYHPDKNPGDAAAEETFKEAAEAYSILSDDDKRQRYDRFGHQGVQGAGAAGFDPSTFCDFADILGDLFGFGRRSGGAAGGPQRGADLRYDLELTFEEAAFGSDQKLRVPRLEKCDTCSGSGSASGKAPVPCSACGGRGQVRVSQGFLTFASTCPQCRGEGRVISDPCRDCRGAGRVEKERSLEVRIPAGVDTGSRMRLIGEGEQGRLGGPTGDLYVVISVKAHPRFERDGATVFSRHKISYPQAVLGAKVEVETIHGTTTLDIPSGTQNGKDFHLRGQGIERVHGGGKGEHVVVVDLGVPNPRDLGEEELDLLRRLAALAGDDVKEPSVLDKVKNLFS